MLLVMKKVFYRIIVGIMTFLFVIAISCEGDFPFVLLQMSYFIVFALTIKYLLKKAELWKE